MRPLAGVVPLPFERLEAWDLGHIGRGQAADGGNQTPRRHRLAGLGGHPPEISGSIILCPGDPRFEADVAVQVEAVGDVIEVASFVSMTGNALRIWPTGCRPTGYTWCLTAMPRSAARCSTYSGSPTTGA